MRARAHKGVLLLHQMPDSFQPETEGPRLTPPTAHSPRFRVSGGVAQIDISPTPALWLSLTPIFFQSAGAGANPERRAVVVYSKYCKMNVVVCDAFMRPIGP